MASTESTASNAGDDPPLSIEQARREHFARGDANWYLPGLPEAPFEPFLCELRMKFLHHDATKEVDDKTDSSWFHRKEVDLSRVAAWSLVSGVEYHVSGDLVSLLTAQVHELLSALLDAWPSLSDGPDVTNMKLRMPQLQPPNMPASGSAVRPKVVNRVVQVPHPDAANTLLYYSPTDPQQVLWQTMLGFDAIDDAGDIYSVQICYKEGMKYTPELRAKKQSSEDPNAEMTYTLDEEQARSVLDPRSWSQALVDQHLDKSKDPMPRAMMELIVNGKYATADEWADVLEAIVGDSFKEGHAFNISRGRWKQDPTYATKRDDANRELNGRLQGLVSNMEALLKPQPGQDDNNDHPNLGLMATYLFEIRAPILRNEWLKQPAEEADEANGVEGQEAYCLEWDDISCDDEDQFATVCTAIRELLLGAGQAGRKPIAVPVVGKGGCIDKVRARLCEPGFVALLDADKYLLPFRDGVYELNTGVFRPLRPTDYVTRSIPYEFAEVQKFLATSDLATTDPTDERSKVLTMLKRIYPQVNEATGKHDVFEYVMSSLYAQMLCGDQSLTAEGHKVVNHTGDTRNGKTLMQKQLLYVFGDADDAAGAKGFFAGPAMSLFTTPDKANAPATDLMQLHQARCVCIDEANNDQKNPLQEGNLKKYSGGGKAKARKCHDRDLQDVSMHGAGFHFFGNDRLHMQADDALDQRLRTIKYEAFFARNDKERKDKEAKGHPKDYIFDADPALDRDEQRRKWAAVVMALLLDRWERYHRGRDEGDAENPPWPEATPPGKWPPMPPLVQEWTDADKGGGDENPYREWVAEHVVLCGSPDAACQGWSADGRWTCTHYLPFSEKIKKAMDATDPYLFKKGQSGRGVSGGVKVFQSATRRNVIGRISEGEQKRLKASSRSHNVFPGMQLRSELGGAATAAAASGSGSGAGPSVGASAGGAASTAGVSGE